MKLADGGIKLGLVYWVYFLVFQVGDEQRDVYLQVLVLAVESVLNADWFEKDQGQMPL